MDVQTIINIIAIFLSPAIAIWFGELLRRRNFKKDKRLIILYNLMAYRYKIDSEEFLSSLNSIKLFYRNKKLDNLIFELRKSFLTAELNKSNVLIAEIIQKICELEKFNYISIDDIDNLFSKK